MNSKSRIKVNVSDLIDAVEAKKQKYVTEQEAEIRSYGSCLAEWREKTLEALNVALATVEAGRELEKNISYSGRFFLDTVQRPSEPKVSTDEFDKVLATLRIAAEPTIVITTDDYARYIG